MATITSTATGNWADGSTWVGGVAPVKGDVAVIAAHTVTVAAGTTAECGTSPNDETTAAINLNNASSNLVVDDGATLNIYGNFTALGGAGANLYVNAGATINFRPDDLPATSTKYVCKFGTSSSFRVYLTGTGWDAMAQIAAPSGYSWHVPDPAGGAGAGRPIWTYAKLTRCDSQSGTAASRYGYSARLSGASAHATMDHVIFDECGFLQFPINSASSVFDGDYITFVNSPGSKYHNIKVATTTTVTYNLTRCVFDAADWNNGTAQYMRCTECYFDSSKGINTTPTAAATSRWNVFRRTDGTNIDTPSIYSTTADNARDYVSWGDNTTANPHWSGPTTTAAELNGVVYQYSGTATNGDLINSPFATSSAAWTIKNCLSLANSDGGSPGVAFAPINSGTYTVGLSHNSFMMNLYGVVHLGETYTGHAGMVTSFANNFVWLGASTPTSGGILHFSDTSVADKFTAAGALSNWVYGGTSFDTDAENYESTNQTAVTASGDVYDDPNCVDLTRNMLDWAVWWGTRVGASGDGSLTPDASGTFANARLLLLNAFNGTFAAADEVSPIQTMIQYLRRGYIPRNATNRGGGTDGLTAGLLGGWMPAVTVDSASASSASCTTNASDGTAYWVITTSSTAPDYDRVLAGEDHTGAAVASGFSGNQAVASTTIAIDLSGATLASSTDYYLHVAHKGAGTEAALDDYLKTSEVVTSSAFQAAAAGDGALSFTRALTRSVTGNITRRAA